MAKLNLRIPEAGRNVMILQHGSIIIQECCIAPRHYVEIVCGPSVLVIVNNRCHESGENLEIGQPVLQQVI